MKTGHCAGLLISTVYPTLSRQEGLALVLLPHLLTTVAKLLGPGGTSGYRRQPPHEAVTVGHQQVSASRRKTKPGPKGPSPDLVRAIAEHKRRNPRSGRRRIALIVSRTFGVAINNDVVRRVLAKYHRATPGDGGPSWLIFLGHMQDGLWSIDLFRCKSILLKSHWVLVVMDQFTHRIIGFGVHAGEVDGVALCRLFSHAISGKGVPRHPSSDHDPLFEYHRWKASLRILDVEEIKTVPRASLTSFRRAADRDHPWRIA